MNSMSKPDETDFQILAELDLGAREKITEIAKRLNLCSNTIQTRIDYLEEQKVIKGYFARIDFFRLGYACYRIYLKLQHSSSETNKKIMDSLTNSPYCRWCGHARGRFDIAAIFWSRNNEFSKIWDDFKKEFKHYVREAALVPYYGDTVPGLPFTKELKTGITCNCVGLGEAIANSAIIQNRLGENFSNTSKNLISIDDGDKKILQILSSNGRASFSGIGKIIGLTASGVKYRMQQLVDKKIITGYRAFPDLDKLGFSVYKVDFNLDNLENKEKIEQHLLSRKNVSNLIKTANWADVETCMVVKSSKDLYSVIHEVNDAFPDSIRDFDVFELPEQVKTVYMPDF